MSCNTDPRWTSPFPVLPFLNHTPRYSPPLSSLLKTTHAAWPAGYDMTTRDDFFWCRLFLQYFCFLAVLYFFPLSSPLLSPSSLSLRSHQWLPHSWRIGVLRKRNPCGGSRQRKELRQKNTRILASFKKSTYWIKILNNCLLPLK